MKNILTLLLSVMLVVGLCGVAMGATDTNGQAVEDISQKNIELGHKGLTESQKQLTKADFPFSDASNKAISMDNILLKTEKVQNGLKITALNPGTGKADKHTVAVLVSEIRGFNGLYVMVYNYDDDGKLKAMWIQEVMVINGFVLIPDVEFSSIIVDGYTGTYTQELINQEITTSGLDISIEDVNSTLTISTVGTLPASVAVDENNTATMPANITINMPMYNETPGTATDVSFSTDGIATFNGINSSIALTENITTNYTAIIKFRCNNVTPATILLSNGFYRYIYITGGKFAMRQITIIKSINDIESNRWYVGAMTGNSTHVNIYLDGILDRTSLIVYHWDMTKDIKVGWKGMAGDYFDGDIDYIEVSDRIYNASEIIELTTFYSGLSASVDAGSNWTAINSSSTVIENCNTSTLKLLTTENVTLNMTTSQSFLENTTLITEVETAGVLTDNVSFTPAQNSTSGSMTVTPTTTNMTYGLDFASTNSNATAELHNGTVTISTGALSAGELKYYNFTVKTLEDYNFTVNWTAKSSTSAAFDYTSSNSEVEQDIYLSDMSAGTYDLKNSTATVMNATVVDGWLRFEDAYPMPDDSYTVEKQTITGVVIFVAVLFAGLSFVAATSRFIRSTFAGGRRSRR